MAGCWYILLSGCVFLDGCMYLPGSRYQYDFLALQFFIMTKCSKFHYFETKMEKNCQHDNCCVATCNIRMVTL